MYNQFLDNMMKELSLPGVILSVQENGETRTISRGTAVLGKNQKIKRCWQLPLRSVTKTFLVASIIKLLDRQQLDDKISKYLDLDIQYKDEITVMQLMNMSSGIADYPNNPAFIRLMVTQPEENIELETLAWYGYSQPNEFLPGTRYKYCDTNTLLLAMIVEKITKKRWYVYLEDTLFKNMCYTVYPNTSSYSRYITGYDSDDEPEIVVDPTYLNASGGLISNYKDMHKWIREYINITTLDPKTFHVLENEAQYDKYGVGIGIIDGWYGHTGSGLGFSTLIMYNDCRSIYILANKEDAAFTIFRQLISLM